MTSIPPDRAAIAQRLRSVSGVNGWTVLVVSLLSTLIILLDGNLAGVVMGFLVLASPLMELAGHYGLKRGELRACRWLPRSQLWLLGVLACYCIVRLLTFDPHEFLDAVSADVRAMLAEVASDENALLALVTQAMQVTYAAVLVASILYQGGLWLYYRRRTRILIAPGAA